MEVMVWCGGWALRAGEKRKAITWTKGNQICEILNACGS